MRSLSRSHIRFISTYLLIIFSCPIPAKAATLGPDEAALSVNVIAPDVDLGLLAESFGSEIGESLDYTFDFNSSGWSGVFSGTYLGKALDVTYSSEVSSPSDPLTWTSSGSYGSDSWSSSGSTLFTDTGGESFQVDYDSSLTVGSNTGNLDQLLNGTENASSITLASINPTEFAAAKSSSVVDINVGIDLKKKRFKSRVKLPIITIHNDCKWGSPGSCDVEPVPEPSSALGTLAFGALGAGFVLKRQPKNGNQPPLIKVTSS